MAASNAPKHDFAPAWLKIPAQENPKSSGSKPVENSSDKSSRLRRDESSFHNSYNRYGPDYARLHRQHSFDAYYDTNKRYPPGPSGKYRHHSVDDDYYAYSYGQYYYSGYYDKFGVQYNSQPSLVPRTPGRDGKYPSSRYGQLNGAYPYYDLYPPPYDFYPGSEVYYSGYQNVRGNSSKRAYYEKEGHTNPRDGREKDGEKAREDDKDKPFIDDFPSLNGNEESVDVKTTKPSNGAGVWDHHPLNKTGSKLDDSFDKNPNGANIYKALIPSKSGLARRGNRDSPRLNGSLKDSLPFSSGKPPTPTGGLSASKEGNRQSPTPPLDILNTRFVTQPKNLVDKKSEFLRGLKSDTSTKACENGYEDDKDRNANSGANKENEAVNGFDDLSLKDADHKILSSSLEAEQRLLREMGWDEQDDEEYIITEDDKKEFEKMTQMVQMAGRLNGQYGRVLPKTWSPKHNPLSYSAASEELNETLSSSDTDSDEELG